MAKLASGLALLGAIAFLFSAIGWARVVNSKGDGDFILTARQAALPMIVACAALAGWLLVQLW